MAADKWIIYDTFKERIGDGTIDLDADVFKIQLHTSTHVPSRTADTARADLSNELATANGYTAGGATLASVTWVEATGTITFDSADPSWTASGGSLTARFAVIYDDTPTTPVVDPLLGYSLLDNAPADVTVTDGNTLTIQINASGIFTLAGGETA